VSSDAIRVQREVRPEISRRQVLGVFGAAAGSLALAVEGRTAVSSALTGVPCTIRVAAVCFGMAFHNHRQSGVNLEAMREKTAQVARERPDFVCYPEVCSCIANGFAAGIESAPELEPYVAEVGKIAREFNTAIVAPFLEYDAGRVYNSVPIVDRQGELVLVYQELPDDRRTRGGDHTGNRSAGRRVRRRARRRGGLLRREL
jgi:hypothetical protein